MHSEAALKLSMLILQREASELPGDWSIEVRFINSLRFGWQIRLVDEDGKVVDTESEGVEPSDVGHLVKVAKEIVAARPKYPDHLGAKTRRVWTDRHGPGLRLKRGYRLRCTECGKDLGWEDGTKDTPAANANPDSDVAETIAAFNRDFPINTKVWVKVDGLFEEPSLVASQAYCLENKAWAQFEGIGQRVEIKDRVRKRED